MRVSIQRAHGAYQTLIGLASGVQSPLLLFLRLYWGWQFFVTGKGKLGRLPDIAEFFSSLGIPFPMFSATLTGVTECVGGLFLMAGLLSRLTAIPLSVVMIVAYSTADREDLKTIFTNDPDKFLASSPLTFFMATLVVLAFGPGKASLDYLIARMTGGPNDPITNRPVV